VIKDGVVVELLIAISLGETREELAIRSGRGLNKGAVPNQRPYVSQAAQATARVWFF
jgi:hypothetical protein